MIRTLPVMRAAALAILMLFAAVSFSGCVTTAIVGKPVPTDTSPDKHQE